VARIPISELIPVRRKEKRKLVGLEMMVVVVDNVLVFLKIEQ
jgi:hypothetical protein